MNATVASSSRPLKLRRRSDLIVKQQRYQGREYRIVKDPLTLKFFRFEEEEYAILEMLDGRTSADQIKRRFERMFPPQRIRLAEIQNFVGMLYSSNLLVSQARSQGEQLLERANETRKREFTQKLSNILSIRFRGFDPDRMLGVIDRFCGWFFTPTAFALSLILCLSALILVLVQFETFSAKLPSFQQFFVAKNWIYLGLTLTATKIIHELGHGLACKRFGSHCHEMGVMFLVLMPCLYCNVSDSWMLPNKWKRIIIGAAGMYVEVVLAALCTFLWWFSEPGMFNYLCLNVMFVSSVSTILFNANPLLRYDGYYILSDLIEIPNLRQKASSMTNRTLGKLMLGIEPQDDPFLPKKHRWFFYAFSIVAPMYRWLITFSIFWFLYKILDPYGFKIIGQLLAAMAIWGLLGQPIVKLFKFFYVPGRIEKVKSFRATVSAIGLLIVFGLIAFFPLPHFVACTVYIEPQEGVPVYVEVPGIVKGIHTSPQMYVEADSPLLTLQNSDRIANLKKLQGDLAETKQSRRGLESRETAGDESAERALPEVDESIQTLKTTIANQSQELQKLLIKAPLAGFVMPMAMTAPATDSLRLQSWHGHPLETRNRGAYLTSGTPVCQIVAEPSKLRAVLVVEEDSLEFLRVGQQTEFFLNETPFHTFNSTIKEISTVEMKNVPKSISSANGGDIITETKKDGSVVPQKSVFQATANFTDETGKVYLGATGKAKIKIGSKTVGQRVWRYLCKTFNFDL